jgi:hypothetical protein
MQEGDVNQFALKSVSPHPAPMHTPLDQSQLNSTLCNAVRPHQHPMSHHTNISTQQINKTWALPLCSPGRTIASLHLLFYQTHRRHVTLISTQWCGSANRVFFCALLPPPIPPEQKFTKTCIAATLTWAKLFHCSLLILLPLGHMYSAHQHLDPVSCH